jgi:hypothetical protein
MIFRRVGFSLIAEAAFGDELLWIQVGIPGAQTSLTLVNWFDEMPPGSLRGLVIDCEDLDYQALTGRGVSFTSPPSRQPGGVFAILSDPDGNLISLRQAGSWPPRPPRDGGTGGRVTRSGRQAVNLPGPCAFLSGCRALTRSAMQAVQSLRVRLAPPQVSRSLQTSRTLLIFRMIMSNMRRLSMTMTKATFSRSRRWTGCAGPADCGMVGLSGAGSGKGFGVVLGHLDGGADEGCDGRRM